MNTFPDGVIGTSVNDGEKPLRSWRSSP